MKNSITTKTDKQDTIRYYLNDKLHREDGSVTIFSDGTKKWYINGDLRKIEKINYRTRIILYYLNNKLHREDGAAVEIYNFNKWDEILRSREFYFNDQRHRIDGPAYEFGHVKLYFRNDKLHRIDGPAIENGTILDDGKIYKYDSGLRTYFVNGENHYYLNDKEYFTERKYEEAVKLYNLSKL